ncbi:MAG: hypothetical protein A2268_06875 [Candidatus Raymondbacteria bacterium RifOxyA12_full_50_37]|uniref:FlgD Ig-like domain-containing protein n=1 Tax=Candidatus Raymondbacteria bacterium RIFOXYD12_FULL_49_13 TaxID=1817890 RepID=A0A1F7FET1_UNCRA|nr:MAG: hypothetical protein A2268_06875 [Candidatus Raymondbacteria bacterium RifOxyA12_full_50_37]OGJ91110.1 MAG: hypothetical protein A2248_01030 [Candidatus Raymondbacteria bacterium RIFOXYA2_FULL_49_16]OGJ97507.1 MAG: hypothetical protein A2453_01790 [Candidatus Raymondbacteria bacterium RIFOXYC2_FULL_50_21]OGJ99606.1 MAG: hypothetical protein A2487_07810 [Candidatus Raymondbacteria bacterium RifOxyC12_full_50_8]OGK03194.1 MAG: hypothetical protein A2350_05200 [Candidatus Raymondbacteria b
MAQIFIILIFLVSFSFAARTTYESNNDNFLTCIEWNGKANNGRCVASGMYIYRVNIGDDCVKTRKMIVVK